LRLAKPDQDGRGRHHPARFVLAVGGDAPEHDPGEGDEVPSGPPTPSPVTLTDIEAVFRSLKSKLGLRPIFHHKPIRAEGHLFITVLAYQLVQGIRRRLRSTGESASWNTLRQSLEGQQRITETRVASPMLLWTRLKTEF